jgi:hypothetical protein
LASWRNRDPDPSFKQSINWLPMDKAAEAIVDIASSSTALDDVTTTPVFHISSTNNDIAYADVVSILKKGGLQFDLVPATNWLARLQAEAESGDDHSCLRMLDMWHKNVSSRYIFETEITNANVTLTVVSMVAISRQTLRLSQNSRLFARRHIRKLCKSLSPTDLC